MKSPHTACLYCAQLNPLSVTRCQHCGMPLPAPPMQGQQKRQWRFVLGFVLVAAFCVLMIWWLPR